MPSIVRTILLAVHAAAIAALVGVLASPIPALGSPLPRPVPGSVFRTYEKLSERSDFASRLAAAGKQLARSLSTSNVSDYAAVEHQIMPSSTATHKRGVDTNMLDNLGMLNSYYTQTNQDAQTINNFANQQGSQSSGNADFNQQYVDALSSFQTNFLGFQTVFSDLAEDKGLANYHQDVPMETLLKNMINCVKYTLNDVDASIAQIPGLGPPMANILYQVKCIVDAMMDATENMTDAIVNDIVPLLSALGIQATNTACDAGIDIAGLCVL